MTTKKQTLAQRRNYAIFLLKGMKGQLQYITHSQGCETLDDTKLQTALDTLIEQVRELK